MIKKALLKKLGIAAAILVLAVIGLLITLSMVLGSVVKGVVENVVPPITGTTVTVDSCSFSLLSGTASIKGLVIGNPEGFKTEQAFKLDYLYVNLELASLLSDDIHVQEITIDGIQVIYEQGLTSSNLSTIKANVEKATASQEQPEKQPTEQKTEESDAASKGLAISVFDLKNGKVSLSTTIMKGKAATVPLPPIHLENLGKKSDGSQESTAEVIGEILDEIIVKSLAAIKDAPNAASGVVDDVQETGKKAIDNLRNMFK